MEYDQNLQYDPDFLKKVKEIDSEPLEQLIVE